MASKLTFFVLQNSDSQIKQLTVSKCCMIFAAASIFVFMVSVCGLVYRYHHISVASLDLRIACQADEISRQQDQVQAFANEINMLKTQLINLNSFEKRIKIIANIEDATHNDNLFGVGGSTPDDLNPEISLGDNSNGLLREMHEQVEDIKHASLKQEDGFKTLLKNLENKRNLLASTPAIMPTDGWLSSGFGYRISPFTDGREFHKGLDIGARKGTPVLSTADGIITYAGRKGSFGKVIVVNHGHGMISRYAHLSQIVRKRGESVKRGDVIGKVGNTGRSTGTHLHYEISLNGLRVNPANYILN